jgi:hypothetical protein
MHDTKERLSVLWIFALLNYLYVTIETVATSVIVWQAWTWSMVKPATTSERGVGAMQDQGAPI